MSDNVLAASIRDTRKALGDNPKTPRFIETVYRRGYRFIAPVAASVAPVQGSKFKILSSQSAIPNPQPPMNLVGRESELVQLHQLYEKAMRGERQIVFVTGEPGIGKTALIETFLARAVSSSEFQVSSSPPHLASSQSLSSPTPHTQPLTPVFLAHGQCIEQFGEGEAYLPILTALGQLGRSTVGPHVIEVLNQYAPSWLVQMPALVPTAEFGELRHKTTGTTRPRMLRELAEALEALTSGDAHDRTSAASRITRVTPSSALSRSGAAVVDRDRNSRVSDGP